MRYRHQKRTTPNTARFSMHALENIEVATGTSFVSCDNIDLLKFKNQQIRPVDASSSRRAARLLTGIRLA